MDQSLGSRFSPSTNLQTYVCEHRYDARLRPKTTHQTFLSVGTLFGGHGAASVPTDLQTGRAHVHRASRLEHIDQRGAQPAEISSERLRQILSVLRPAVVETTVTSRPGALDHRHCGDEKRKIRISKFKFSRNKMLKLQGHFSDGY